jgi:hypothetical protein
MTNIRRLGVLSCLLMVYLLVAGCDPSRPAVRAGDDPVKLPPKGAGNYYFVAGQDAAASDANDGAESRPFKTVTRGVQALKPGDTLWIHSGVYRGYVQMYKSGEGPDKMIAVRAYPGDKPVIKGSELLGGWTRSASEPKRPIWETDWPQKYPYPSMIGCDDEAMIPLSVPPETEALKPPKEYCQYFVGFGRGREAMFPGSFFYDEPRKKLLVWLKNGDDPRKHEIDAAVSGCAWDSRGKYTLVDGLTFKYGALVRPVGGVVFCMTGSASPGGEDGDGNIARNLDVSLGAFQGMVVRGGQRVTTLVENCYVHHNGQSQGGFDGQGLPDTKSWMHVRRCRFTDNNLFYWNPSWDAGSKHFGRRVLLDECEMARNYHSPGVWFDCKSADCIVNRCYAHDNGQFGLYYEIGETGAFINNVVEGIPNCCALALNGSSRTLLANNLVIGPERGIIVGWEGNVEGQTARVTCHNRAYNNIMVSLAGHPQLTVSPERDIATDNLSDCNFFWQRTPFDQPHHLASWPSTESGYGQATTLAQWQQQRKLDLASRVIDPRVEIRDGRMVRLPGSPACSGGKRLTREILDEIFANKPMPPVTMSSVSTSIQDHKPPSAAFLEKVAELLAVPENQPMPIGPLPAGKEGR